MQKTRGKNNARTLFGIVKIPTDNQIRNLVDPMDPALLRNAYRDTFSYLQGKEEVESFRSSGNTLLVALGGRGITSPSRSTASGAWFLAARMGEPRIRTTR